VPVLGGLLAAAAGDCLRYLVDASECKKPIFVYLQMINKSNEYCFESACNVLLVSGTNWNKEM
jgi:hypothetical protein